MSTIPAIRIDVWSDYVCPFCYLELPALQALKTRFGDGVDIRWHAFELRPEPHPTLDPAGEYLRTTWDRSVYPMARERGMTLRLPPVQPRSRKAFEAAAFAAKQGRFDAMHEALFRAFFEEGRDIGRIDVLVETGAKAGVQPEALRAALQDGRHEAEVLADQELARRLGVTGVPLSVLRMNDAPWQDGLALQGAVPIAHFEAAIDQLQQEPLR